MNLLFYLRPARKAGRPSSLSSFFTVFEGGLQFFPLQIYPIPFLNTGSKKIVGKSCNF